MGEEADPQLLQQPAVLIEPGIGHALLLGQPAQVALLDRTQLGQAIGVALRVGTLLVQPRGDGLQVARKVLQLAIGRGLQEALGQQALQLRADVVGHLLGRPGIAQLALGRGVVQQNHAGQPRHILGDQVQAAAAFGDAGVEGRGIAGQRLGQEGTVQRQLDDLRAQLVGAAQRHVGRGHLDQIGDVFFQVLQRFFDGQRHQPAQAGAVLGRGHGGLVEDLDLDMAGLVDQRREADQHLAGLVNFHQLGQFTEGPGGVGHRRGGQWRRGRGAGCGFLDAAGAARGR